MLLSQMHLAYYSLYVCFSNILKVFLQLYLEREELMLLLRDLKLSPRFITFFPDVEKFLENKENNYF